MKILSPIKKSLFLFFITSFLAQNAFCWSGYDYDKKTEIEIGEGNLVRENEIIQFYDLKDDNFHTAKVIFLEEDNSGTRIQVEDLDEKRDRIFIMEQ